MSSLEIRYNALYCCKCRARELRRQFPQWPLGSSTTHCSTGAVKYCRKTRPHCSSSSSRWIYSLPPQTSVQQLSFPLASSIMLFSSLHTSQHHPSFLYPFQSSFSSVSCIPSPGVSLCDMNMYSNTCFRCWCYALNTLRVQNPPRWYVSHRLMHSF